MYIDHILLLLILFTLALTLPSTQDFTSPPPIVSSINRKSPKSAPLILDLLSTSNSSLHTQNTDPVCNGSLLGFDMNRYSCLQTLNTIPTHMGALTFGDRLNGRFDVPLPRRFTSRKCVVFFHSDLKGLEVAVDEQELTLAQTPKRTLPALSMSFIKTVSCRIWRLIDRSHRRRDVCMGVVLRTNASALKVAILEI